MLQVRRGMCCFQARSRLEKQRNGYVGAQRTRSEYRRCSTAFKQHIPRLGLSRWLGIAAGREGCAGGAVPVPAGQNCRLEYTRKLRGRFRSFQTYFPSGSCSRQYFFQRILTAGMTPDHICIASSRLLYRTANHLMRNRIGKEYDQIRTSDLLAQIRRHLGKYLCLAFILFTDFLILTYHPVMTTYDNNTHIRPPEYFICYIGSLVSCF